MKTKLFAQKLEIKDLKNIKGGSQGKGSFAVSGKSDTIINPIEVVPEVDPNGNPVGGG